MLWSPVTGEEVTVSEIADAVAKFRIRRANGRHRNGNGNGRKGEGPILAAQTQSRFRR